jgi:hypothetical protein
MVRVVYEYNIHGCKSTVWGDLRFKIDLRVSEWESCMVTSKADVVVFIKWG